MPELLFLSAPLKERIWGSDYFKKTLGLTASDAPIGEMWSVSGLAGSPSIVTDGKYEGCALNDLFHEHGELFGSEDESFPILVKLLSTNAPLSVQVHPDDAYAQQLGLPRGKTEGWLIIGAEPDADIVIGCNARSKAELEAYVERRDYEGLLRHIKVKPGEFYPIPAGTIHALGKGLTMLEIQQSADVTFRLYDYGRMGTDGKLRELHVLKAIEATKFHECAYSTGNFFDSMKESQTLWDNRYFRVDMLSVHDSHALQNGIGYKIATVCQGSIKAAGHELHQGDSFIMTAECRSVSLTGEGRLIITLPKQS